MNEPKQCGKERGLVVGGRQRVGSTWRSLFQFLTIFHHFFTLFYFVCERVCAVWILFLLLRFPSVVVNLFGCGAHFSHTTKQGENGKSPPPISPDHPVL